MTSTLFFLFAELETQFTCLALDVLFYCDRVSCSSVKPQTPYVAMNGLELLILLPSLPESWDYRQAPAHSIYVGARNQT